MEASDHLGESAMPAAGSLKAVRCIRILIADDHLIARVGVSAILNAHSDMIVVAEATNGLLALSLYREYLPEGVGMDMRMLHPRAGSKPAQRFSGNFLRLASLP